MKTLMLSGLVLLSIGSVGCGKASDAGTSGNGLGVTVSNVALQVGGTGCDSEMQQLAAIQGKPVNVGTLGASWGGTWELICGLADPAQCPAPNSFACDFGNLGLIADRPDRMIFTAVGTAQNIDRISNWFLLLNSGTDSDGLRTLTLSTPTLGDIAISTSLYFDGQLGYMVMVRADTGRRAVYRTLTSGPPSW